MSLFGIWLFQVRKWKAQENVDGLKRAVAYKKSEIREAAEQAIAELISLWEQSCEVAKILRFLDVDNPKVKRAVLHSLGTFYLHDALPLRMDRLE